MIIIRIAASLEDATLVRGIFREYQNAIGTDLCFQKFEDELAHIPGKYAPPAGRLYLAFEDGQPVGCAAVRRLAEDV